MNNPEEPQLKKWRVTLKGTKFLPRQSVLIEATNLHRNSAGDLIFVIDTGAKPEVIASYNRECTIGAVQVLHLRKPSKKDREQEVVAE